MTVRVSARQGPKPAHGNRRAATRYRCAPATFGKIYSADLQHVERAWVLNLGKTGVGLMLSHPMSAGTLVVVHLRAQSGQRVFELPARVAHATCLAQSDWLVGCELIQPLEDDDLEAIL